MTTPPPYPHDPHEPRPADRPDATGRDWESRIEDAFSRLAVHLRAIADGDGWTSVCVSSDLAKKSRAEWRSEWARYRRGDLGPYVPAGVFFVAPVCFLFLSGLRVGDYLLVALLLGVGLAVMVDIGWSFLGQRCPVCRGKLNQPWMMASGRCNYCGTLLISDPPVRSDHLPTRKEAILRLRSEGNGKGLAWLFVIASFTALVLAVIYAPQTLELREMIKHRWQTSLSFWPIVGSVVTALCVLVAMPLLTLQAIFARRIPAGRLRCLECGNRPEYEVLRLTGNCSVCGAAVTNDEPFQADLPPTSCFVLVADTPIKPPRPPAVPLQTHAELEVRLPAIIKNEQRIDKNILGGVCGIWTAIAAVAVFVVDWVEWREASAHFAILAIWVIGLAGIGGGFSVWFRRRFKDCPFCRKVWGETLAPWVLANDVCPHCFRRVFADRQHPRLDDPDANLPTRVSRRPMKKPELPPLAVIVLLAIWGALAGIGIVALVPPPVWSPWTILFRMAAVVMAIGIWVWTQIRWTEGPELCLRRKAWRRHRRCPSCGKEILDPERPPKKIAIPSGQRWLWAAGRCVHCGNPTTADPLPLDPPWAVRPGE